VFRRLFGRAEDAASQELGRLIQPEYEPVTDVQAADPPARLPPRVDDLTLPEPLAEAAAHPPDVNLSFDLSSANAGAPPLSDAQIDELAQRVADKLTAGVVGDRLRDTVRRIVAETSERLVREEIARVRAAAERGE
jgi:hypothetical protein